MGVVLFGAAVAAQRSSAAGETAEKVSERRKLERERKNSIKTPLAADPRLLSQTLTLPC